MYQRTQKVLRGAKVGRRHTTFIPHSEVVIQTAKAIPEVSKVVLGRVAQVRSAKSFMRTERTKTGIKVVVRGSAAWQQLFIFTTEPDMVANRLKQAWDAKYS